MQRKNRIVDAKFLQFTNEGHILVLVPRGGDLLTSFTSFTNFKLREDSLPALESTRHTTLTSLIQRYFYQGANKCSSK